ncbi:Clp protease N-terminal domain-containing protein [Arthrobacter sp. MSA 4-2]|uniref:Clp protease N-terminal domain-containing protein n=1 Tax=Arthrobacter sp. MSA 4-2 TaxID=2794349 RepID=UPI0018E890B5|nr:Clp protease N-terminal domain-containing protein [Arthrobacter sp. MSA 4-2]MBJ2121499.1 Clp protease N-terminal domain-containing protein [Arthrobacter sp. MSA 4-2]
MIMGIKTALSDVSFMNSLFTAAEHIAHQLGDPVIGAEHLVIAALERDDSDLRTALAPLPLNTQRFRDAVLAVHADALSSIGLDAVTPPITEAPKGALGSTATAQEVFQDARTRAKKRHAPLAALDILAAAARLEHGTTARALARLGVDRAVLEALAQ